MDESGAFRQAILEGPSDEAARLIYADWLEDRGDEESRARADLIRVQYALEEVAADDPRRLQLQERERDLLLTYGEGWAAPVRAVAGVQRWKFRKGFVESVSLVVQDPPRDLEKLAAAAPVRELQMLAFGGPVVGLRGPTQADI